MQGTQHGQQPRLEVHSLDEETALSLIRDHQPPRDERQVSGTALAAGSAKSNWPAEEPAASAVPLTENASQPNFASDAEEAAAREIVRALGGFTLAVEQVALYLGLILDATLAMLGESSPHAPREESRTSRDSADTTDPQRHLPPFSATGFPHAEREGYFPAITALLLPDTVPWPWLRALTIARQPELGAADDLGADPWLAIQRRLTGLSLLEESARYAGEDEAARAACFAAG